MGRLSGEGNVSTKNRTFPATARSPVSLDWLFIAHHCRVLLGVCLPQVEHLALDHVRDVSSEPVARQLVGIGVPLDAAQILPVRK